MKKFFLLSFLLLAGCATQQQFYEPQNFETLGWAKNNFDQAKADCKDAHLEHHWLGDTYELAEPAYKACMEKQGYHFKGAVN